MNVSFHIPAWLYVTASTYLTTRTLASALNVFFWYHNPDDWAAFVEGSPRLALLVRISRAWGIDWRKILRLIRTVTATFRKQGLPLPEAADVVVVVTTQEITVKVPAVRTETPPETSLEALPAAPPAPH